MSDRVLHGSCLCGAVRYELSAAPDWSHHCHCSRCRKSTGAGFASNLFVPIDALRFTAGEAEVRRYKLPEAERFTHAFCARCGGNLPFRNEPRGRAVVPMGSLDDDPGYRPRAHIFVDSKPAWTSIGDDLPRHSEALASGEPRP